VPAFELTVSHFDAKKVDFRHPFLDTTQGEKSSAIHPFVN